MLIGVEGTSLEKAFAVKNTTNTSANYPRISLKIISAVFRPISGTTNEVLMKIQLKTLLLITVRTDVMNVNNRDFIVAVFPN